MTYLNIHSSWLSLKILNEYETDAYTDNHVYNYMYFSGNIWVVHFLYHWMWENISLYFHM